MKPSKVLITVKQKKMYLKTPLFPNNVENEVQDPSAFDNSVWITED